MASEPFDLESVRRRWARTASVGAQAGAPATPNPPSTPTVAATRPVAPLDPFDRARADLAELRRCVAADLRHEAATLEPFLLRVERAVAQIEQTSDDPKALHAELEDALFDLEDLLEALTLVAK